MDAGAWSCGMVAGLIHDIPTVAELIDRIMAEAERLIRERLDGLARRGSDAAGEGRVRRSRNQRGPLQFVVGKHRISDNTTDGRFFIDIRLCFEYEVKNLAHPRVVSRGMT